MQPMDIYQLGRDMGDLRTEVRMHGARQIYVQELTLREVRDMRREVGQKMAATPAKPEVPRLEVSIKEVLRWAVPAAVLLATGSLDKALQVLGALK